MQTLRAKPVLLFLVILLALTLLTGAVYAIGRSLGYIPGVGIIDQSAPLRVLAEPVTMTREGVTITVTEAVLSADKTVILLNVEGVPSKAYPNDELIGCMGNANLRLADGTLLEGGHIGAGGWTHFENRLEYGPIPANVNEAALTFDCIGFTRAGALPENWDIPLRFAPAPPDIRSRPSSNSPPPRRPTRPPPMRRVRLPCPNTMTRSGIIFTLEKFVEVEGGYQLYGSLDLSGATLPAQSYFSTMDMIRLTDANGNRIPFEEHAPSHRTTLFTTPTRSRGSYRTNQKAFAAPLTLTLPWVEMQITPQVPFELDLGADIKSARPGRSTAI